jgi:hypothetical protein
MGTAFPALCLSATFSLLAPPASAVTQDPELTNRAVEKKIWALLDEPNKTFVSLSTPDFMSLLFPEGASARWVGSRRRLDRCSAHCADRGGRIWGIQAGSKQRRCTRCDCYGVRYSGGGRSKRC